VAIGGRTQVVYLPLVVRDSSLSPVSTPITPP
jgi:hypothetical protein